MTIKEMFRHHHRPTDAEKADLWESCIFAFDTNVLLNVYRYADATREDLFRVMKALNERLWIPHQVALEFYTRRLEVIQAQRAKFDEVLAALDGAVAGLKAGAFRKSAFLGLEEVEKLVKPGVEEAKQWLEKLRHTHPDLIHDDPYLETLAEIIGDGVGSPYDPEQLVKHYTDAQSRIAAKCPPGFADHKKPEPERYGDVIIWFQVLDHAVEKKRPIIFVTDDDKDDWWHVINGQKLGPRPELRAEMWRRAQVEFMIYNPASLLERAGAELKLEVADSSIDDAKETAQALQQTSREELQAQDQASMIRRSRHSGRFLRALGHSVTQSVIEWLLRNTPDAHIERVAARPFDLIMVTGAIRIGFNVHHVNPDRHGAGLIRIEEAILAAEAELSSGHVNQVYQVIVAANVAEASRVARVFTRRLDQPPMSGFVFGHVDDKRNFVLTDYG
jgi:hypothetical protein